MKPISEDTAKAVGKLGAGVRRQSRDSGQSMLELALMLPFLALLLLGIVEMGRAIYYTIAVNNAATAGAEYGSQSSTKTAGDYTGMQNSATMDANFSAMSATGTRGCTCDNGNGNSCVYPVPSPSTCDPNSGNYVSCTGGTVVECVQVTTTANFSPLFSYPGLPSSFTANGKAVMRVRN